MKLFISLLPEITFITGASLAFIGLLVFTNLAIATIFAGAFLMVVAAYLTNVMNISNEQED